MVRIPRIFVVSHELDNLVMRIMMMVWMVKQFEEGIES